MTSIPEGIGCRALYEQQKLLGPLVGPVGYSDSEPLSGQAGIHVQMPAGRQEPGFNGWCQVCGPALD